MYSEEDLKGLGKYLVESSEALTKDEKHNDEDVHALISFKRQLEVIHYNPLLFLDIIKRYDVDFDLMGCPLKELPLHINDGGVVCKAILHWRLDTGK